MSEKPRRTLALMVSCPKCRAKAGVPCQGKRGDRVTVHQPRVKNMLARALKIRVAPKPAVRRPKREGFYWSDAWRALRYDALVMHGGACQCCGAEPSPGKPLHVDHIKPRSKFPELELEISNLQVLCDDCNLGKGARDQTDWRPAQPVMQ